MKRKTVDFNRYQHRSNNKKRKKILLIIFFLSVLGLIYVLIPHLDFKTNREEVKKYEQIGIFCKQDTADCFYIDKQGIVFEAAPKTSGGLIVLIKDYSSRKVKLYDKVLDSGLIDTILEIKDYLPLEIGLSVVSFDIDNYPTDKLRVITNESWYVLLGLKQEIKKQLLSLKVVLDEKIEDRMSLQYIDLRIENRIYYK
ncbi:MAG: cell division protein FtsQ/DivIB [Patescibacteria group bacterium]